MSIDRLIASHLRLAKEALDAAQILARIGNRNAAYQAAQALEQVILAHAQAEGVELGRSHHHRLDTMARSLPADNSHKHALLALTWLETSATAYRYPKTAGGLRDQPSEPELQAAIEGIATLIEDGARCFGVDLLLTAKTPASRTRPPRS